MAWFKNIFLLENKTDTKLEIDSCMKGTFTVYKSQDVTFVIYKPTHNLYI